MSVKTELDSLVFDLKHQIHMGDDLDHDHFLETAMRAKNAADREGRNMTQNGDYRSIIEIAEGQVNRVQFEGEAREIKVDGHKMTGVWTDGVMLSSDNGRSPWQPGHSPCAVDLKKGKKYRITIEEIGENLTASLDRSCS